VTGAKFRYETPSAFRKALKDRFGAGAQLGPMLNAAAFYHPVAGTR
jgi:hypothetical protein